MLEGENRQVETVGAVVPKRKVPKWIGWPLLAAWTYLVLNFLARQATFHPAKYPAGFWDHQKQLRAEDVWLQTSDAVRIHAWMLRPHEKTALLTVYLHGNAGNLTHRIDHMLEITSAGSNLFLVSYRGYGKSEGSPTEEGIYRDADAAYQYLAEQGYAPRQIVVHGESLGTAPAVDLASRRPCAGVILEAPFPSARAVASRVLPLIGPLVVSGLETAQKIPLLQAPLLIMHGDQDEVIPYDLGRQVFAAAREPKEFWTIPGAHHNDIIQTAGSQYRQRLKAFYAQVR